MIVTNLYPAVSILKIYMSYWPSVRSRWLNIDQVFFCVLINWHGVEVQHKLAKKELGQSPALLTAWLVNNSYVRLIQLVYKNVTYQTSAQTALNVLWTQCLQTAVREPVEGRLEQPCVVRMLSACWTVKQVMISMLLGKNGFASITSGLFSIKTDWTKRSAIQDQT